MKEYVGIQYQNPKKHFHTLPHNNPTQVYIARVNAKHKEAILMYVETTTNFYSLLKKHRYGMFPCYQK